MSHWGYDELIPAYCGPIPDSRDDAARLSAGVNECPLCAGSGLTVLWGDDLAPHRADLRGRLVPAYCHACAMGRWIRANHERDDRPDVRVATRAFVDLAGLPRLQTLAFKDKPTHREYVRADVEAKQARDADASASRRFKRDLAAELVGRAGRG